MNATALNTIPLTLGGVQFTGFNVNTSGLTSGDKFVVNVAAAAKLDNVNTIPSTVANFESNENIIMYEDLSRMGVRMIVHLPPPLALDIG